MDEIGQLIARIDERLAQRQDIDQCYRIDPRILAWVHDGNDRTLISSFETIEQMMRKPVEVAGKRVDVTLAFGIAAGSDLASASLAASKAAEEGLQIAKRLQSAGYDLDEVTPDADNWKYAPSF